MRPKNKQNTGPKGQKGKRNWAVDIEIFFVLSMAVASIFLQFVLLNGHYRLVKILNEKHTTTTNSR